MPPKPNIPAIIATIKKIIVHRNISHDLEWIIHLTQNHLKKLCQLIPKQDFNEILKHFLRLKELWFKGMNLPPPCLYYSPARKSTYPIGLVIEHARYHQMLHIMKRSAKVLSKLFFTVLTLLLIHSLLAQDSTGTTIKTTTTTQHTEWYAAPWVWIVGGIIVILLIAGIVSGNRSRTSRTTITDAGTTKTITTDTDEV